MPRPAIDRYWQSQIEILAETPISVDAIAASLRELTPPPDVTDPAPSSRTVARYVRECRKKPDAERRPHRPYTWPESMLSGDLPWEASRALFDLLRLRAENGRPAPLVDEAKWFWRVTLAAPEAPIDMRADLAGHLTLVDRHGRQPHPGAPEILQRLLAYQPWRSEEDWIALKAEPKQATVTNSMQFEIPRDCPPSRCYKDANVVSINVNRYTAPLLGRDVLELKRGYE